MGFHRAQLKVLHASAVLLRTGPGVPAHLCAHGVEAASLGSNGFGASLAQWLLCAPVPLWCSG